MLPPLKYTIDATAEDRDQVTVEISEKKHGTLLTVSINGVRVMRIARLSFGQLHIKDERKRGKGHGNAFGG